VNEKLDLLKIIYDEVWNAWQSDFNTVLTEDQAEFLTLTFCKKSDLILKTVNTYVNSIDPTEIILILNILGLLTTQCKLSENVRSLLINCKCKYISFQYNLIECKNNIIIFIDLLMSLHMMGKETDNYFTPITNLRQVAPNTQRRTINVCSNINDIEKSEATAANCDPQEHPAYGFKAGLIQVIANVVHKNKMCQDLVSAIIFYVNIFYS